ncbi:ssDNA-binding protein [Paenibacillus oryzisoli]|uniref:ssDNA-binding protein n=1 Tax=Paenibacillus oryzisoli TaxID=1850517 RepID=UPI003D283046
MLNIHDKQRVITGKVRFIQLKLQPSGNRNRENGTAYLITVLIPKSDAATKRKMDAAVHGAIEEGVRVRWKETNCLTVSSPVRDGDSMADQVCHGHWVLTATAKPDEKPGIVDRDFQPILNSNDIFAGMYGRVSLYFAAEDLASGTGIGVYVKNIQKLEDGTDLDDSRANLEVDFIESA